MHLGDGSQTTQQVTRQFEEAKVKINAITAHNESKVTRRSPTSQSSRLLSKQPKNIIDIIHGNHQKQNSRL